MSEQAQSAPSCVMVIFGAGGDPTKRKLILALYYLAKNHLLPKQFAIIAVNYRDMDNATFRQHLDIPAHEYIGKELSTELWLPLLERIHYLQDVFLAEETFDQLSELLTQLQKQCSISGNSSFYLATRLKTAGQLNHLLKKSALRPGAVLANYLRELPNLLIVAKQSKRKMAK